MVIVVYVVEVENGDEGGAGPGRKIEMTYSTVYTNTELGNECPGRTSGTKRSIHVS